MNQVNREQCNSFLPIILRKIPRNFTAPNNFDKFLLALYILDISLPTGTDLHEAGRQMAQNRVPPLQRAQRCALYTISYHPSLNYNKENLAVYREGNTDRYFVCL